jgi:hypothetical protein
LHEKIKKKKKTRHKPQRKEKKKNENQGEKVKKGTPTDDVDEGESLDIKTQRPTDRIAETR